MFNSVIASANDYGLVATMKKRTTLLVGTKKRGYNSMIFCRADVIILAVPSFAHEEYFTKLGPSAAQLAVQPAR